MNIAGGQAISNVLLPDEWEKESSGGRIALIFLTLQTILCYTNI
jgi:hypothetical protein